MQKNVARLANGAYKASMELKTYIEKNNLTLREFADQIDRNVGTVSRIVRGETMPSPDTIKKIMVATRNRVKANDFYGNL